jgi:polysaccharide deacetylase 2 family uncharacterized protein YibQ
MPKGKRIKRRGGQHWIGYLLSFLLGSLLAIGVYLYLIQEKPTPSKVLSQKIFLVDQIIHSQLYEIGISKKDVLQKSTLKKEGDIVWEQSFMKIQLPRSFSFSLIEGNFKRSLSTLGKPYSIQSSKIAESLQMEVKVQDRLTHQLTFIPPKPSVLKAGYRPKMAIVIDDLGIENHISQELLHWNLPITFSILPFTPYSKTIAQEAHRRGKEVILHLPMEPHGYPKKNPGDGALLYKMDEEKLLRQLSKDIEAIPYIQGVSNHMGSRLMEDPEKMKIILSELKRRGLYFLDSRTTPQTVGLQTAQALGLASTERDVFLDHVVEEEDIIQSLERLAQEALISGRAIGVGHPHPATLRALKRMVPKIQEKGIEIVPLSALID